MAQDDTKSKPGPRKGALHKKNSALRFELLTTLQEKGYDPAAKIIETREEAMEQYRARLKESKSGFGSASLLSIVMSCDVSLLEYVYPKLARSELTGRDGKDLFQSFTDLVRQIANEDKPSE